MRARRVYARRGLAQVVTTLLLLVFSVLLSGIAIYYSVNIISTRLQTEDVRLTKEKVWVNSTGAVAALKIQNLGGRDILIDKIEVRGVESSWSTIWYHRVIEGSVVSGEMNVTSYALLDASTETIDGRDYTQASADIPLASGLDLLLYIKGPDNIQVDDIGTTVSISMFTINAQYVTECNVKSAT